jgi:tRNA1(Val) A37 N6-methylase TrmN6
MALRYQLAAFQQLKQRVAKQLNTDETRLERAFSVYFIDTQLESRFRDRHYVDRVNTELVQTLAKLTNFSVDSTRRALRIANSQKNEVSIANIPATVTAVDFISAYNLDIDFNVPVGVTPVYLCSSVHAGPGIFPGVFPEAIGYLQQLRTPVFLCIYLPYSQRYSQLLLNTVEAYLKRVPTATVWAVAAPQTPTIATTILKKTDSGYILYANRSQKNALRLLPFPYSVNFIQPFAVMYRDLEDLRVDPYTTIAEPGYACGVVFRDYDTTYLQVDSISNHFTEKERMVCHKAKKLSAAEISSGIRPADMSAVDKWASLIVTQPTIKLLSLSAQRDLIYSSGVECNLFLAGFAKIVFERYGGNRPKVLDVPGGWGDRLIAAAAVDASEIVTWDTNPALAKPYQKIQQSTQCNLKYYIQPFEQAGPLFKTIYHQHFDIAISSPPFFDEELYAGTETSTTLYTSLANWLDDFYKPLIQQLYEGVRPGGYLCLYLPKESRFQPLESSAKKYLGEAIYHGILGLRTGVKIRNLHIYQRPQQILPLTKVSYAAYPAGILTQALREYFVTHREPVYLNIIESVFDYQAVCWACADAGIPCYLNYTIPLEFQTYGAVVGKPNNGMYFDPSIILEIHEAVAKYIRIPVGKRVFLYQSTTIENILTLVERERKIKLKRVIVRVADNVSVIDKMLAEPNFDAQMLATFRLTANPDDTLLINH